MENHETKTAISTKGLLAMIFDTMRRLHDGEIDSNTAIAQAKLASQASNVLNYELKRTIVQLRLQAIGSTTEQPTIREIETK